MLSKKLVDQTLDYFNRYVSNNFVVKPSLPILYFGDLNGYQNSQLKVVTVGKNPSRNEFRLNNADPYSFIRFPLWQPWANNLEQALNGYFHHKPLNNWFSSFEPILNGMNCSYYYGTNIAIHTDICSPIATDPTWSLLSKDNQAILFKEGFKIWQCLIEELQPDVMLISIPRLLFNIINDDGGKELITFTHKQNGDIRRNPYLVTKHNFQLKTRHKVDVIFGQAANKPFDTISNTQKKELGKKCLK